MEFLTPENISLIAALLIPVLANIIAVVTMVAKTLKQLKANVKEIRDNSGEQARRKELAELRAMNKQLRQEQKDINKRLDIIIEDIENKKVVKPNVIKDKETKGKK